MKSESIGITSLEENRALAIQGAWVRLGWKPARLPTLATREFDTACAARQAAVYLYPSGWVHAEYWSEGRNVLAGFQVDFALTDASAVEAKVARMNLGIGHAIDQTYARGLWLSGLRPTQLESAPG